MSNFNHFNNKNYKSKFKNGSQQYNYEEQTSHSFVEKKNNEKNMFFNQIQQFLKSNSNSSRVLKKIDPLKNIESEGFDYKATEQVNDELTVSSRNSLEYIELLHSSNEIKSVVEICKIDQTYEVIDISLTSKGRDEENEYLKNFLYLKNISRGNTLLLKKGNINIKNESHDNKNPSFQLESMIIRRGMRKFLDLDIEFVSHIDNKYIRLDHLKDEKKLLSRKIIFSPIFNRLREGKMIKVHKMVKANGENAQISYCSQLKSWVICSKNVTILAKNVDDLYVYSSRRRYQHAHAIGICWFEILEGKSKERVNQLKEYLNDYTFIGEYIGNQYYQHLVRYTQHTILFYSIISKEDLEKICVPIEKAIEVFYSFGLSMVSIESIGIFKDWTDLSRSLQSLYRRISESSIVDEEEGSVIYLSSCKSTRESVEDDENKEEEEEEVLSLCKLKTLEYRVYRKLREKLTNHIIRNKDDRFKINQFFDEVRNLISDYTLPMPLDFYYKFAETAFDFIKYIPFEIIPENLEENDGCLRQVYLDFVEVVLSMIDETMNLVTQSVSDDRILNKQKLLLTEGKIEKKDDFPRKFIEIYAYFPPFYENFEKIEEEIMRRLRISIGKQGFSFGNQNRLENQNEKIIFNIIHWHSFKNIRKRHENQFFIFMTNDCFDLKSSSFNKSIESIHKKSLNPQYKTYITDASLRQFFKSTQIEEITKVMKEYYKNSLQFKSSSIQYFNENAYFQIGSFEEKAVEDMITWVIEKYEYVSQEKFIKNDENDCFLIKNERKVNDSSHQHKKMRPSRISYEYKGYFDYIDTYNLHRNPFESVKKEYLQEINNMKKKNKSKSKVNINEKLLVVLVPMTLPGTGKTTFVNSLREIMNDLKIQFFSISSDAIRADLMSTLRVKNRKMTREEAFSQTGKYAGKEFEKQLKYIIDLYLDGRNDKGVLYIDKNHPPNAISRTMDTLKDYVQDLNSYSESRIKLKFVALVSDSQEMQLINQSILPFSLEYLYQCYERVYNRRDHETLNGDNPDLTSIFGMFISNFIDFHFGDDLLVFYKFDNVLKLPFTQTQPIITDKSLIVDYSNYILDSKSKQKESLFKDCINNLIESKAYVYNDTYDDLQMIAKNTLLSLLEINSCRKDKVIPPRQGFIYIGLRIKEDTRDILKFISQSILQLKAKESRLNEYDNYESKTISDRILDGSFKNLSFKGWSYPKDTSVWHVTTFYALGLDENQRKANESYKEFSEGRLYNIEFDGFIYVPYNLMCAYILNNKFYSNNPIPHLTLLTNGYLKPRHSNTVISKFFTKDKKEIGRRLSLDGYEYKVITIDGYEYDAYCVKYTKRMVLKAEMASFMK